MIENNLLPIGSVILNKDASKKMMIIGYYHCDRNEPNKVYDYVGCLYPEGRLDSKNAALFNNSEIAQIVYKGFTDDESNKYIKSIMDEKEKKINQTK